MGRQRQHFKKQKLEKIISLAEGMQSGITPVIFHTNTGEEGEELNWFCQSQWKKEIAFVEVQSLSQQR